MTNPSSNDNFPKTLSFFPFVSDGGADDEVPVLKQVVVRLLSKRASQIASSPRPAHRETAPIIEPCVVSRYKVDDYGRPRILSKAEIIIHDAARWTVIAVIIGYALAISLVVIHNPSMLQPQQKATQAQEFALQELEP